VLNRFHNDPDVKALLPQIRSEVERGSLPVVMAVQKLLR